MDNVEQENWLRSPLFWIASFFGVLIIICIILLIIIISRRSSINQQTIQQSNNLTITPTAPPIISPSVEITDLPPLYSGVEWEATESGKFSSYQKDPYGPIEFNGYRIVSPEFNNYPLELIQYYQQELEKKGWKIIAGTDDIFFYEKHRRYFTIGVNKFGHEVISYQIFIEYN